jgi:hypothetical protein
VSASPSGRDGVQTVSNIATADGYTAACTLGPIRTAEKISYLVANNSAVMQVAGHGSTEQPWSDELLVNPSGGELYRVQGARWRSAVAGQPARIIANLVTPDDPLTVVGQPFTGFLAASGGVLSTGQITGIVLPTGAIFSGSGFVCTRNSLGNYTLTWATPFSAVPVVVIQPIESAAAAAAAIVYGLTSASCSFIIYNPAAGLASLVDQDFMFIASPVI